MSHVCTCGWRSSDQRAAVRHALASPGHSITTRWAR
jgi:hypothetical protein